MKRDKKICIIPLRAGSKSIKGKNKKKILGRPLFAWCIFEAIQSNLDFIYVFTDDVDILNYVKNEYSWSSKVVCMERSPESAIDNASTEFAMKELATKINFEFDIICLLQATSPLITSANINNVLNRIVADGYDSALTVVKTKQFFWSQEGKSLNYNYLARPRRQDFKGVLIENGAAYASLKSNFIRYENRISGNIGIVEVEEDSLYEIDELHDWAIIKELLKNRLRKNKEEPCKIKCIVFDVDGVFTDGSVLVSDTGEFGKIFSLRDGMGFELLKENNIEVVIMTSEHTEIVIQRMKKLKIGNVFIGIKDKFARLGMFLKEKGYRRNEVAYIGDDINDLSNILSAGWGICPKDAMSEVKYEADLILNSTGGHGAIREAIEFIIKYNLKFRSI